MKGEGGGGRGKGSGSVRYEGGVEDRGGGMWIVERRKCGWEMVWGKGGIFAVGWPVLVWSSKGQGIAWGRVTGRVGGWEGLSPERCMYFAA